MYFGKKPNLGHLKAFGNIAYVHVPKEKRRKLDAKAEKCILVDYSDEQKSDHLLIAFPHLIAPCI
mgnify:FL=1